jgi:Glycosyl transferase family 2
MIDAIAIVVPVNNEAQSLPSCIGGIRAAIGRARTEHPEVSIVVCFVLDRCTDNSGRIIKSAGYWAVDSHRPGVGASRATGVSAALKALGGIAEHRILVACTDADSVVPSNWLTHQMDLADEGADVIVGAVRPKLDELDDERRQAWQDTHLEGQARGHVHGANLGVRAIFYLAVGGFASVREHEDVDLVTRVVATGGQVRPTEANCVITSGRLAGRTAGGYAGYLRDELIPLAESNPIEQSVA